MNISHEDNRLEIVGKKHGENFQGTGLNRHCKFLMLEYAFYTLQAVCVEFRIDERNVASRIAVEKIGAQLEGILRRHTVLYNGFRRNTACYSILLEEWENVRENFYSFINFNR